MKTKRFEKKLVLNKATVADLTRMEMKGFKGGKDDPHSWPPLCNTIQQQDCVTFAPGYTCDGCYTENITCDCM